MVYKKPKMLLLELEEEDVVTLSNLGPGGDVDEGGDNLPGVGGGDDWFDDWE